MKALDTGVLLSLLEGSAKARDLLRKLRGLELGTTEANLLELSLLAAGSGRARGARFAALEKLRQRVTALPIDARAVHAAAALPKASGARPSATVIAMMGALQAAGCDEILTDDRALGRGQWGLRVRIVSV